MRKSPKSAKLIPLQRRISRSGVVSSFFPFLKKIKNQGTIDIIVFKWLKEGANASISSCPKYSDFLIRVLFFERLRHHLGGNKGELQLKIHDPNFADNTYITKDHLLAGEGIRQSPSPNVGEVFQKGLPDTLILHYTGMDSSEDAINRLCDEQAQVSAHLLISREGGICQMVKFNQIAWHAGQSQWGDRTSLNKFSIGIELDNAGYLEKKGSQYISFFGGVYNEADVFDAKKEFGNEKEYPYQYWHRFSSRQLDILVEVARLLTRRYSISSILGHSEVAPQRKFDPGPAFPMAEIRSRILS